MAKFPCAYAAGENLIGRTGLKSVETVIIMDASGEVGSAIQLCCIRGARVIASVI